MKRGTTGTLGPSWGRILAHLLAPAGFAAALGIDPFIHGLMEELRAVLAGDRPGTVVVEQDDEFPLRFAERMNPPYALAVLDRGLPAHAAVVARTLDARRRVERAGGIPIAQVAREPTPYRMALSNRFALAILRLVRPPERFGEYRNKGSPETWSVYRVP